MNDRRYFASVDEDPIKVQAGERRTGDGKCVKRIAVAPESLHRSDRWQRRHGANGAGIQRNRSNKVKVGDVEYRAIAPKSRWHAESRAIDRAVNFSVRSESAGECGHFIGRGVQLAYDAVAGVGDVKDAVGAPKS